MQPNEQYPQQPPQSTPPQQPPAQNLPDSTAPMVGRSLQPISSEEDIRQALASTELSHLSTTTREVPSEPSPIQSPAPREEQGINSLPNPVTTQTSQQQPPSAYRLQRDELHQAAPKKKHRARLGLVVFLVLAGCAAAGYYFFANNQTTLPPALAPLSAILPPSDTVVSSDLIQSNLQDTSYLRPKQWQKIEAPSAERHGNMKGADGKSTAIISVVQSPQTHSEFSSIDPVALDNLRSQVLATVTEQTIAPAFEGDGGTCTSEMKLNKEADTATQGVTIGIYKVTASCNRADIPYTLKTRTVAGRDGHIRMIAIMATQSQWDKNEDVFKKILSSIEQTTR